MKSSNIGIFIPHVGCPNQCSFCDQHLITGRRAPVSCAEVVHQLETAAHSYGADSEKLQVAFFGGSFTAIDREYMISLLETVSPYIKRHIFSGIRISTRPDCIDETVLRLLKAYGVTAIELGAQSMDDAVLEKNRRGHTAADVVRASEMIRGQGIELGLQMMTGLYGDSDEGALETARQLIALSPDTMRIYPTVVLRGTQLHKRMLEGCYAPPGVEDSAALCAKLVLLLEGAEIRLIRLGLHSSPDIEHNFIAGAYHPAFKELVENKIFLDAFTDLTRNMPAGRLTVAVHPGSVSKVIGQNKRNLLAIRKRGFDPVIETDGSLSKYELRIKDGFKVARNAGIQIVP